ncbi:MAG: SIMPL domain-containing protein [Actinobacteria bacterium]|nr:SIMPL domain-containing protein [Actinomycetota bacterium]
MAHGRRWMAAVLALGLVAAACDNDEGGESRSAKNGKVKTRSGFSSFVDPTLTDVASQPETREGVTVAAEASVELDADEVFIVITPSSSELGDSAEIDDDTRRDLVRALDGEGVEEDEIDITPEDEFSYGEIRVRIDPDLAASRQEAIVDAVSDVIGVDSEGLALGVSDCTEGLTDAQESALDAARDSAASLASAVGVKLGKLAHVTETADPEAAYGGVADPCDPESVIDTYTGLLALGSEPKVELTYRVLATFAIDGAEQARRSVSAVGTAETSGAADEAYVLVLSESFEEEPEPLAPDDREELLDALLALGYDEEDIEIDHDAGSTRVEVEVEVGDLPRAGRRIVDEVEDVLGESSTSGVVFTSSECETVLADARKAAFEDAGRRLDVLASASDSKLAAVVGVAESGGGAEGGPTGVDPCGDVESVFSADPYSLPLEAFDAEPVFKVRTAVMVTRALK